MRKNSILPILIIVLSINFLSLGLMMLTEKDCVCPSVVDREETAVDIKGSTEKRATPINALGQGNETFIYGNLKKEEVPEGLDLGDFWYWIYFEDPYLLVQNATGVPLYVEKMQVLPAEYEDFYDIEDFVNKKVEIYGYQTWGYAETSVFQITAIREY
jgi:hypothetical protein